MKKFIIIMLGILTLSACANLEADYTYVDHGTVSSVYHESKELILRHDGKSDSVLWHLPHTLDDMSLRGLEYTRRIKVGDEVWIYQKGNTLVASNVNIMQARKVKAFLADYNLPQFFNLSNILWLIGFAMLAVLISLWLYARHNRFTEKQTIIFLAFIGGSVINATDTTNAGARLKYECSGKIKSISGNMIRLTDNQGIFVNDLTDICHRTPLKKDMAVHFYRYSNQPGNGGYIIFASKEEITSPISKLSQTYPNSWLFALVFVIALWIAMGLIEIKFGPKCAQWYQTHFPKNNRNYYDADDIDDDDN